MAHLDTAFITGDHALLCAHFPGPASTFTEAVRGMGEGVIGKRLDSTYHPGKRSGAWVKLRLNVGQEFVIAGYTPSSNGSGFGAVIVGYYRGDEFLYVARVRAGFIPATRRALFPQLERLRMDRCPFSNLPQRDAGRWGQGLTAAKMKDCVWIRPS